jgi:hypothetical protein
MAALLHHCCTTVAVWTVWTVWTIQAPRAVRLARLRARAYTLSIRKQVGKVATLAHQRFQDTERSRGHWQAEPETAALAHFALDSHLATVSLDQVPGDGQPQAGATVLAGA